MEYQPFIIDVPAGEGHQEYCTIFQGHLLPRHPEARPCEEDRRFGITIDAGLISAEHKDLIEKLSICDGKLNIGSLYRPQIVLRNYNMTILSAISSADYLASTFEGLSWVGIGPDKVCRYVSKRLLVKRFDYKTRHRKGSALGMLAVEMNVTEIDASLKLISEQWREEQEARFGA